MNKQELEMIRARDGKTYGAALHDLTIGALLGALADRHQLLDHVDVLEVRSISNRPAAWIRGISHGCGPDRPPEYDEECVPGEDQPKGTGWVALYARPADVLIDTCDHGHKFAKLPDHPLRDGVPRCPHCLAIGFDSYGALANSNQVQCHVDPAAPNTDRSAWACIQHPANDNAQCRFCTEATVLNEANRSRTTDEQAHTPEG